MNELGDKLEDPDLLLMKFKIYKNCGNIKEAANAIE